MCKEYFCGGHGSSELGHECPNDIFSLILGNSCHCNTRKEYAGLWSTYCRSGVDGKSLRSQMYVYAEKLDVCIWMYFYRDSPFTGSWWLGAGVGRWEAASWPQQHPRPVVVTSGLQK